MHPKLSPLKQAAMYSEACCLIKEAARAAAAIPLLLLKLDHFHHNIFLHDQLRTFEELLQARSPICLPLPERLLNKLLSSVLVHSAQVGFRCQTGLARKRKQLLLSENKW